MLRHLDQTFVNVGRSSRGLRGHLVIVAIAAAIVAPGCGKNKGETRIEDAFKANTRIVEVGGEGMRMQEVDLDRNGSPNIFNYFIDRADGSRQLLRKEVDLSGNGKPDLVTWFDDSGNIEREELDSDFDGSFDWTDHYQNGARVMSEYDTNGDNIPDVFKYYVRQSSGATRIDREERDTNYDGKIDYWAKYGDDGEVIRTGRDTDFDGKVDVRD